MDANLTTLLVALVGPTGIAGLVALVLDRRRKAAESAPALPPGEPQQRVAGAVDVLVEQLVEAHSRAEAMERSILTCSVVACPVRQNMLGAPDGT